MHDTHLEIVNNHNFPIPLLPPFRYFLIMAGLVHPTPTFGFHPAPVNHSPSPLGFGFGLTSSHSAWQPQANQSAFLAPSTSHSPSSSHVNSRSTQKRRHDDVEDDIRDEYMDRSPTPERSIRRIIQKRVRTSTEQVSQGIQGESSKTAKEATHSSSKASDGVDVGMLLGTSDLQTVSVFLSLMLCTH